MLAALQELHNFSHCICDERCIRGFIRPPRGQVFWLHSKSCNHPHLPDLWGCCFPILGLWQVALGNHNSRYYPDSGWSQYSCTSKEYIGWGSTSRKGSRSRCGGDANWWRCPSSPYKRYLGSIISDRRFGFELHQSYSLFKVCFCASSPYLEVVGLDSHTVAAFEAIDRWCTWNRWWTIRSKPLTSSRMYSSYDVASLVSILYLIQTLPQWHNVTSCCWVSSSMIPCNQ